MATVFCAAATIFAGSIAFANLYRTDAMVRYSARPCERSRESLVRFMAPYYHSTLYRWTLRMTGYASLIACPFFAGCFVFLLIRGR